MKNNRTNKFISLALAVIMLIGMMPMSIVTVSAASDTDYVASVTIGSETKNYKTIDEAFDAAEGNTATITLMDDCITENNIIIKSGDITLDTADYTATAYTYSLRGGKLTVKGNGGINDTSDSLYCVNAIGGEFVLESGTVPNINVYTNRWSEADVKATVKKDGVITNGLRIEDTSDTYSTTFIYDGGTYSGEPIGISGNPVVEINGGEFTADYTYVSGSANYTFADLLGEGKAYFNANGEMIVLTEGQKRIDGSFTVGDVASEIAKIKAAVEAYDIDTVTSADTQDISALKTDISNTKASANLTEAQASELDTLAATLDSLVEKIAATAAEINRIDDAVNAYDINKVTSADKADINKLFAASEALQDSDNITEAEEAALKENDAALDSLVDRILATEDEIDRIVEAVNGYDEGNVNSSDKAGIEKLIADIKALTDGQNITENERTNLEYFDSQADELIEKIAAITSALEKLEDDVNCYSIDTVKSTDKETIENLKAAIESFTYSSNITNEEKTALYALHDKADAHTERIEETAAAMAAVTDKADDYDLATVTIEDKDEINGIIADIDEIIASSNVTQEEIADLNETKAGLNAIIAKFDEATARVEKIGAEMPDKNRVTVFWEDDIKALIAEIEALLVDAFTGAAEKAKLNEYKAQAEEMLEIIRTPAKYFSLRFFYLILDLFTHR